MSIHSAIQLTAGDDWVILGQVQDANGQPLNLSQATTIEWILRRSDTWNVAIHSADAPVQKEHSPTQGEVDYFGAGRSRQDCAVSTTQTRCA